MMKTNKTASIHMRVTEEELAMFKEKTKKYPSMTSMLLAAVKNLNEHTMSNRMAHVLELKAELDEQNRQLGRMGANLNQIAKYFNQISNAGIIGDYWVDEALKAQEAIMAYKLKMEKLNDVIISKILR